jgi:hypothetical protein
VQFNDTILHNISYGRLDASFEEVLQASEAAQIKAFVESLPDKWQTVVGERGDDVLLYSVVTYNPALAEHLMATGRAEAEWRRETKSGYRPVLVEESSNRTAG